MLLNVGSDDAVITSFEISADHKNTYVAFYEPNQEGLNGSVWMFDTDNGTVLEKYDNVCYQPVKSEVGIMYFAIWRFPCDKRKSYPRPCSMANFQYFALFLIRSM